MTLPLSPNSGCSAADSWEGDASNDTRGSQTFAVCSSHWHPVGLRDEIPVAEVVQHLQAVDLALQRALRLVGGRQLAARLAQLRRLPVAVRPAAPAAQALKSARPYAMA